MKETQRLDFLKEIYPQAKNIEDKTGVPAIAIVTQAVLESGWGAKRIGNNLFGVKGTGTWVLTTEYDKREDAYTKRVESKEFVNGKWKFKVYQEFQSYPSVEASLIAHNRLLFTDRYKQSLRYKHSPIRYLISIWRSGYATDVNYGKKILGGTYDGVKYYSIVYSVVRRLIKLSLI